MFPLNKIDHQDMSAPNKLVTERISKCVNSVFEFINPYVIDLANGKELFEKESAATFVAKIGEPFGIKFDENIVKYVDKAGNKDIKSTLDLCFFSLLEVVQKAGQFSHKNFGGWTPVLALDPLLKSTNDNKELNQFVIYLDRSLIFSLPDEEQD
ncbi:MULTISPECIES: hypothetical protein [Colwellia]|nr:MULTISPECIES: hypothetical protein [Colwellia]